jgi:hypothetical protein
VLVFHNQRFTDETQIAFSRNDAGYQNSLSFMDNYYPNGDRTDNQTVYGCSMA